MSTDKTATMLLKVRMSSFRLPIVRVNGVSIRLMVPQYGWNKSRQSWVVENFSPYSVVRLPICLYIAPFLRMRCRCC